MAHAYQNERSAGTAVAKSALLREEVWTTTKLWSSECSEGKTSDAIGKMLSRLWMDRIDLLLLCGSSATTWARGMTWRKPSVMAASVLSDYPASNQRGKTLVQIILRWRIQEGNIVFPKTTNP